MPLNDDDVREIIAILQRSGTAELRIASGGFELHVVREPADNAAPASAPSTPPPAA